MSYPHELPPSSPAKTHRTQTPSGPSSTCPYYPQYWQLTSESLLERTHEQSWYLHACLAFEGPSTRLATAGATKNPKIQHTQRSCNLRSPAEVLHLMKPAAPALDAMHAQKASFGWLTGFMLGGVKVAGLYDLRALVQHTLEEVSGASFSGPQKNAKTS